MKITFWIFGIITAVIAFVSGGTALSNNIKTDIFYSKWMKNISDSTEVRNMSIAGSHDTAMWDENVIDRGISSVCSITAKPLRPLAICNDSDIVSQWNCGIRAFDLRPYYEDDGGYIGVCHGDFPLYWAQSKINYLNLVKQITDCVREHSSEIAIIRILVQRATGWDQGGHKMNDVKDALINDPIYSKYIDFSGLSNIKNGQTLGESRGKVYFFAYDEKQGIENPTEFNQWIGGTSGTCKNLFFGSYAFDTWKSVDHLRSYLNYDRANNKLGCFQLNKPTDMHLRSPRHYAETIIPEVIEELDSGHYQWTGIVFGDFLSSENPNGESLTHKIVDINFA